MSFSTHFVVLTDQSLYSIKTPLLSIRLSSYANFDGFVVLHGTDTMSYTASALSFMLENRGKPVVLTGSQIPIPEMRSDGRDNLLGLPRVSS